MTFGLPNLQKRSSSPSLQELTEAVQKKIELYRSSKTSSLCRPTMATVPEPAIFTSRTLADPIAAIEICPAYPEYMIVGTYALLKHDEEGASKSQVRKGSIYVVPLAANFKPAYPGAAPPFLGERRLNAAVLDIHFHPSDNTLLGVATSNATMTFFRLVKRADVLARRIEMELDHLGSFLVDNGDKHGETPLITSFCWLPGLVTEEIEFTEYCHVSFAATVSNGDVISVRAILPRDAFGEGMRHIEPLYPQGKKLESTKLGKHSEEAWTVAATMIPPTTSSPANINQALIFSGGDDSTLIATSAALSPTWTTVGVKPDSPGNSDLLSPSGRWGSDADSSDASPSDPVLLTSPPLHLWTDRKTHTAGVVAILPLPAAPPPTTESTTIPILTGSYDEHIRLFLLDTTSPILKRTLILEKKLGGGVWRLKLMHASTTTTTTTTTKDDNRKYSALVLASCMHGGVRILRLTHDTRPAPTNPTPASTSATHGWHLTVLAKFTKGHESMVYGSDWCAERDEAGRPTGTYTVVSTSFYDKAVCVWNFVDDEEQQRRQAAEKGN